MSETNYDPNSLKVDIDMSADSRKSSTGNTISEQMKKKNDEPMSNKKAALVVLMLIAMYTVISALPTFVMMYFFDVSFWLSQAIVLVGTVIVALVFGLHKPATNEQKLKSKFLL